MPIIVDVRDLWPDEMINRLPQAVRPLGRMMLAALERIVQRALRRSEEIVAVSRIYLDWAQAKLPPARRSVGHVVPLGYPDHPEAEALRRRERGFAGDCAFFFSGSFNNSVDLDTPFSALASLGRKDLSMILCGAGDHAARLREVARSLPVRFEGMGRRRAALSLRGGGSFGLSLLNAIPGEAARMVQDHGIGLNCRAGDSDDLAHQMAHFAENLAMRDAMGRAASALFESRFRAETVYPNYATLVRAVCLRNNRYVERPIQTLQPWRAHQP